MNLIRLTFLIVLFTQSSFAQDESRYSLSLGLGTGYDDGLIFLPSMPTMHIGLVYNFNDWVALESNVFSYSRQYTDSYLIKDLNHGYPVVDIVVEESFGPFATEDVKEKIRSTGVLDIQTKYTLKALSIPFTVGLRISPQFRNHIFGLFAGIGLSYQSYNWPRDYVGIEQMVLKDGTVYKGLFLSLNTEFRNITPLEHISLSYSYSFRDWSIGIRLSELARWIGWQHHIFDSSIFVNLKI